MLSPFQYGLLAMLDSLQAVLGDSQYVERALQQWRLGAAYDNELEAAAKGLVLSYASSGLAPGLSPSDAADCASLAMSAKSDAADPGSELGDPLLSDLLDTLAAMKADLDLIAGEQS